MCIRDSCATDALRTGRHEPDEPRGSRPDLWGAAGETPAAYPATGCAVPDPPRESTSWSTSLSTSRPPRPTATPPGSSHDAGGRRWRRCDDDEPADDEPDDDEPADDERGRALPAAALAPGVPA